MSERIGGVHFTASIDGRRTPGDAERIGRQAGQAGAKGFDDEWSDAYTKALDKSMREASARWRRSGRENGLGYGDSFSRAVQRSLRRTLWRNLASSIGGLTSTTLESSGGFRTLRDSVDRAGDGLKAFYADVKRDSDETMSVLRKGASELRISLDDVKKTFPGVTSGLNRLRQSATNTRLEFREFGRLVREDSTRTMSTLREGADQLRISFDDVRKTFPGVFNGLDRMRDRFDVVRTRVDTARESVHNFGNRMRGLLPDTDAARGAMQAVRSAIDDLRRSYRRTEIDTDTFSRTIRKTKVDTDAVSTAAAKAREIVSGFGRAARTSGDDAGSAAPKWGDRSHNFRQFLLIAGAITAASENIAVLGSAAGGGIFVLAAAIGQLLPGAAGLIFTFQGLTGEIDKLPESVRPAAQAFQDLKGPIQELQDSIQERALANAEGAFRSLGDTVRALKGAFEPIADVIGRTIGKLADNLKPGTRAFDDLYTLVRDSAPIFERVLDVVGKLAGSLLDAFGNPEVQRSVGELVGYIETLVDRFDQFVQSEGLGEWMSNTRSIFGELGELIDSVSRALNNLVDERSVERTTAFIDALDRSVPLLESIIEFSGALNIFGLLGQILASLSAVLEPILDVLTPVVDAFASMLLVGSQLAEIIANVLSPAFIPARIAFELFNAIVQSTIAYMQPIIDKFAEVGESGKTLGDQIVSDLMPDIQSLIDSFFDLLPPPQEVAAFIQNRLVPAFRDVAAFIKSDVIPALRDLIQFIKNVVDALGGWEGIKNKVEIAGNAFRGFYNVVSAALGPVIGLIRTVSSAIDALNGRSINVPSTSTYGGAGKATSASGSIWNPAVKMAVGGILRAPRVLAGEAGAEAIVPLQRPLAAVDPAVRWLSAIAQGKAMYAGGGGGDTREVHMVPGAIQVVTRDERKGAIEVVDRLVEVMEG